MKTKIAEVHNRPNDEANSCISDPNGFDRIIQLKSKLMKSPYHRAIDLRSAHRNESKASVYYTPNDSVDQPHQLQSSPMHINFIQENLNFIKPELACKFDFDMHSLEENLEQEIDHRRRQHTFLCTKHDDDNDDDGMLDINTEQTQMLNKNYNKNHDDDDNGVVNNLTQGYIPLNTLLTHNKFKRSASGKDMYYSLENVFDVVSSGVVNNLYEISVSNKTIDETSETQVNSSTSDNSSSNNMSRSNAMTSESLDIHPLQSLLVSNEEMHLNDVPTSNSLPNIISKMERHAIESSDDKHTTVSTTAIDIQ